MADGSGPADGVTPAGPSPSSTPEKTAPPAGRPPRAAAYAGAVLAPAAALAFTAVLLPYLGETFFFVFLAAVVVAAWFGGLRPGVLATLLSAAAMNFFLMTPRYRLTAHGAGDVVKLTVFAALGAGVAALCEQMLRARAGAEESRERAERHRAEAERSREEAERLAMQLQEQAMTLETQQEETQSLNEELEQQVEQANALRLEVEAANRRLRAAAEEAEAARARQERILETMVEGVVLVDAEGRITYANAAAGRILGAPPGALAGVRYDDPRWSPARPGGAAMPADEAPAARVLRSGEALHGAEVELATAAGERRVLRVSAAPLRRGEGVSGAVVSFDDVTADRLAEEALRESEARFRVMADSAPVLIWMAGTDALRDFVNRPWLEFTGRTLEQELGNGWAEGVHPDDYARCMTVHLSSFEARRAFRTEYRLRRHDGEYRWLLDAGVPRFTPDGSFAGFVGSCIDITERREAEEQQRFLAGAGTLLASSLDYEETLRRVCRLAVPVLADFCVIDLLDEEGRVRRVEAAHADPAMEPAMRELRRFPPGLGSASASAEVLRTGLPRVMNEVSEAHLAETASGAAHLELARRLGVRAYMAVPLVAAGRVLGAIVLCATTSGRRYDSSELVRAEELARRAAFAIDNARLYERAVQANRAKSDFLAVMSHELRTPLNAILGYTDLFLFGIPAPLPEETRPQMDRVQAAARHLLELIDEILTFSRLESGQETPRVEPADAAAVARDAAALVEPLAVDRGIGFEVRILDEPVPMETDARKVRQILVNLLGNAVKFTEEGGAALELRLDGGHAAFVVSDTGVGMTPEEMEHIFEPFWQADQGLMRVHGGSGLGLAVARQLARLLGGDITAESRPGEGSVFTLRLPLKAPVRGVSAEIPV